jgi:hypothetical protein
MIFAIVLLLGRFGVAADEIRVMTSGAFAAAYLEVAPEFERATGIASSPRPRPWERVRRESCSGLRSSPLV